MSGELISICTACHKRTYDLKEALPTWIEAANYDPPVEIVVLNYNSPDNLDEYMEEVKSIPLAKGNILRQVKYTRRNYFNMAHSGNLCVLATTGNIFLRLGSDHKLLKTTIADVRPIIENKEVDWVTFRKCDSVVVMWKQTFIDAGGYDERFEFYSPDDKDFSARLERRGCTRRTLSGSYIGIIETPNKIKGYNYRIPMSKWDMKKIMKPIYLDNKEKGILVANEGKVWGDFCEEPDNSRIICVPKT